jgi:Lipase (class 3)
MHSISTRFVLVSLLAWTAVSCGSINNKIIVRDDGREVVDTTQLVDRYPSLLLMDEVALLSAAVYDKPATPKTTNKAEYCSGGDAVAFDPIDLGWQEQLDLPGLPTPPPGVRLLPDLRYRVWVKETGGKKIAVLAFRGTQSRADWFANLRWVTMVVPRVWDHYEQLLRIMPDLIAAIKTRNGENTIIIPAGHSLGGGLAQLAGYSSNGAVKTVFAFDPSTVTHYYGVPRSLREASKQDQDIFRIFEQGEVLSYVRWILKRVYPISHDDPRIVQVKFHRLGGGLFSDHSIRRFACTPQPELPARLAAVTSAPESPR